MKSKHNLALLSLIGVAFGYVVLGMNSRLLDIGFAPATQVYVRILLGLLLSLFVFGKKLRPKVIQKISRKDLFWLIIMGCRPWQSDLDDKLSLLTSGRDLDFP